MARTLRIPRHHGLLAQQLLLRVEHPGTTIFGLIRILMSAITINGCSFSAKRPICISKMKFRQESTPETSSMRLLRFQTRRHAVLAIALGTACAALAPAGAAAQGTFPGKTIRIVNNFPPGGPSDIISRAVAEKMSAALKQTVVVENRSGAGGNIGAAEVAKADADGHTLLTGIDTTFTINPAIYPSMPFALESLKPLMVMASSGLMLGVNPSLQVKSLAEFRALARSQSLNFSSGSNGSPGHLAAEIFGDAVGAKITHVPYKGNSPAVMAVLSGEVQAGILATPGLLPHVKAGKVVPLAVTSRQRSPAAPDTPTVAEAGLKELELEVLYVAMLPAATPALVVEVLRKALADALDQPDVKAQLAKLDLFVEKQAGKAAEDRLAAQRSRFARIIKSTGMKVE